MTNRIANGGTIVLWSMVAVLSLISSAHAGGVVHVDADASPGGNGTSWANAYDDLQDALAAATSGDEIWVVEGTYTPAEMDGDREARFNLTTSLGLYGGFSGGETDRDQADPVAHETILSGDLNGNDLPGFINVSDNAYHVVECNVGNTQATVVLDGFTIVSGNASGNLTNFSGGGVRVRNTGNDLLFLTINRCVFRRNYAFRGGAALTMRDGTVLIVGSAFADNNSTSGPGAVILSDFGDASPDHTLNNCVFERNVTTFASGGAVSIGSDVSIAGCTFAENTAGSFGGAISFGSQASGTVSDCIFDGNSATFGGGAVHCPSGASRTFTGCTFTNNVVVGDTQGVAVYTNGDTTFLNCTFARNLGRSAAINNRNGGVLTMNACRLLDNVNDYTRGAAIQNTGIATITNSLFSGNAATAEWGAGGAISHDGGVLTLAHCTFVNNKATWGGGALFLNAPSGDAETTIITNSIFWGNFDESGRTESAQMIQWGSSPVVNNSLIDGLTAELPGTGNIDENPHLTFDFHLTAGSPAINAGDPGFVVDPDAPTDIDGEDRILGGRVDIGADEFVDADADGLPDWWEIKYFASPTGADPNDDPDGDGHTNLQEYQEFIGDPLAQPFYVNDATGDDAFDGQSANPQGGNIGPKKTLQGGIDAAGDGNTVLVAAGTYAGIGNYELDYAGKTLAVRAVDGPGVTVLEIGAQGRAIDPESPQNGLAAIEGFTITGGNPQLAGGGVRVDPSHRIMLKDCVVTGNIVSAFGGGVYVERARLGLDDVTLSANESVFGDGAWIDTSDVTLWGTLTLTDTQDLWTRLSQFDGPGSIQLDAGATLVVANFGEDGPTIIRTSIFGPGDIIIHRGQELRIEGADTVVDLSGEENPDCADPAGSGWGSITIDGSLFVRDATIRNTVIDVTLANLGGNTRIINNDIKLLEFSGSVGGQFFVEGGAAIQCNRITSFGDRYLDLDPDPDADPRPVIEDNLIDVIIAQGTGGARGELLELRTQDRDCVPKPPAVDCPTGAFAADAGSLGFSDTWVLESLTIEPNAKVNLTNRPGFVFQDASITIPETAYVKNLVLESGAVLNTAFQRLYYQSLSMAEDAKLVNIPLLGFSLSVIELDDDTEFAVRVRTRVRDPNDDQPIAPLPPAPPPPPIEGAITRANGVMNMQTLTASSVAAKGTFAPAGDEDITVLFEYRFALNQNAELIVYLSDDPNVSEGLVEVARIRPPASGLAGSIGSNEFAIFNGRFPRGSLNFHRGTRIELELRGAHSRVFIDRWDPQVQCSSTCADLDGGDDLTSADYLRELAEYGQTVSANDAHRYCLDSPLSSDGYVDLGDLLAWDAFLHEAGLLDSCDPFGGLRAPAGECEPSGVTIPANALLVTGKPNGSGQQGDMLYSVRAPGDCTMKPQEPASCPGNNGFRANGRSAQNTAGDVYQIHAVTGIVRLADGAVVVPPDTLNVGGKTVHVGARPPVDGVFLDLPFKDMVFSPNDENVVYVVPVLVSSPSGTPYQAAAKLRLQTGPTPYTIEQLYGLDPAENEDCFNTSPPGPSACDWGRLREIEIDRTGQSLFILSAKAKLETNNDNDWLLVFNEQTGEVESKDLLSAVSSPGTFPEGPIAMMVSSRNDKLYLASSVNSLPDAKTRIYRYDIGEPGAQPRLSADGLIDIDNPVGDDLGMGLGFVAAITSLTEHPVTGALWVTGFTAPRFPPDGAFPSNIDSIFTLANLAIVDPEHAGAPIQATAIDCHGLALPIAAIFPAISACVDNQDCDDGIYCNGAEVCEANECVAGSERCPGQQCAEATQSCFDAVEITCHSAATVAQSGSVEVELFLANAQGLRGYQSAIEIVRTAGTGSLDVDCETGIFVDIFRPDFVFAQRGTISNVNCESLRVVAALNDLPTVSLGNVPAYMGTFVLDASQDAAIGSVFEISINAGDSILSDADQQDIEFTVGPSCVVTVADCVEVAFGDVAGVGGSCGADGTVSLPDILAVLNAFAGEFAKGCELADIDLVGSAGVCGGDGQIALSDILAVLDAFSGINNCPNPCVTP